MYRKETIKKQPIEASSNPRNGIFESDRIVPSETSIADHKPAKKTKIFCSFLFIVNFQKKSLAERTREKCIL
jgi:hypothetical protein